MNARALVFAGLAAVAACHAKPAATTAPPAAAEPLAATIDKLATDAVAHKETQALSIAVARHGVLTFAKGYGYADVIGQKLADAQTVYRIGSLTKQFTAAAIVQLEEAGKLKLSDDIHTFLPDVPTPSPVTIDQLLHHTSGIPSYTDAPDIDKIMDRPITPPQIVALVKDMPWGFAPGTRWAYSNTGYVVLGMIIEKVSGEPYAQYLAKHVFPAAGLVATSYCDETKPNPHRAAGYAIDGSTLKNAVKIDMSVPFSAGALCSTAGDLVRWNAALAGGKVVSPAGYKQMTTSHGIADEEPYGFGLQLGDVKGHRTVFHNGAIPGFVSELHDFPDDGVTIAVLTNTESHTAGSTVKVIARAALNITSDNIAISAAELAAFAGTYDTPGLGDVAITVDGDRLAIQAPDQPKLPAEYRGNDTFFLEEVAAKLSFTRDATSHAVTRMIIDQGGNHIEAKKK